MKFNAMVILEKIKIKNKINLLKKILFKIIPSKRWISTLLMTTVVILCVTISMSIYKKMSIKEPPFHHPLLIDNLTPEEIGIVKATVTVSEELGAYLTFIESSYRSNLKFPETLEPFIQRTSKSSFSGMKKSPEFLNEISYLPSGAFVAKFNNKIGDDKIFVMEPQLIMGNRAIRWICRTNYPVSAYGIYNNSVCIFEPNLSVSPL